MTNGLLSALTLLDAKVDITAVPNAAANGVFLVIFITIPLKTF